jgi:voltage-gated potassium channel Kch
MNIIMGCCLVILTTFVHATAMVAVLRGLRIAQAARWVCDPVWWSLKRAATVVTPVLIMFLASMVEAGLWAATYLFLGAIADLEEALYFSTVTYTTLGFGDVVMEGRWRLLSSFEAANDIITFGWTTALIVAVVQRVYATHPAVGERGEWSR